MLRFYGASSKGKYTEVLFERMCTHTTNTQTKCFSLRFTESRYDTRTVNESINYPHYYVTNISWRMEICKTTLKYTILTLFVCNVSCLNGIFLYRILPSKTVSWSMLSIRILHWLCHPSRQASWLFNPLLSIFFFRRNTNMSLHVIPFLHTDMGYVVKSFLVKVKDLPISHSKYHDCWCAGDVSN